MNADGGAGLNLELDPTAVDVLVLAGDTQNLMGIVEAASQEAERRRRLTFSPFRPTVLCAVESHNSGSRRHL